jgi:hypothetical protein
MKGSAARMKGVWRRSAVAFLGFSAAFDIVFEASERTDSEVCFAFSSAREAGILSDWVVAVEDMVLSVTFQSVKGKYQTVKIEDVTQK